MKEKGEGRLQIKESNLNLYQRMILHKSREWLQEWCLVKRRPWSHHAGHYIFIIQASETHVWQCNSLISIAWITRCILWEKASVPIIFVSKLKHIFMYWIKQMFSFLWWERVEKCWSRGTCFQLHNIITTLEGVRPGRMEQIHETD